MTALKLDPYIVDTLMPDLVGHDRQPSAFLVYLFLWRQSAESREVSIALQDVADGTGLSKRSVQTALTWLVKRALVGIEREGITAVASYTVRHPWRR